MQKIEKAFISLIIVAILINVLPFKLFADNPYSVIGSSAVQVMGPENTTWVRTSNSSSEVRYVIIWRSNVSDPANGRMYYNVVGVSQNSFILNWGTDNNTQYTTSSFVNSNYNLAILTGQQGGFSASNLLIPNYRYTPDASAQVPTQDVYDMAIYYTFGEGSIVAPSFGDLQDVGFYTKFTNSQQSNVSQMALNKDVITWDNYQDTNGNDLNDVNLRVDIQAASVDYSANTKSDLLNQTINDMLTGDWSDLITISPNVGEYSFTWETVARALFGSNYTANWWNNLFNVFDSAQSVFYKKGWIYRIRLRTYDNSYVGNWQIIYNITSAPPSDSEKVYTNYYIYNYQIPDEETYRVINNINTINNTNNNWYQNDVPFNPDGGSDWLEKLLEFISELIQKILDFFSSIFDGLVDLILGLFDNVNPAESFFNWFSNLFNGIGNIDLTLPQFNLPNADLTSFNRLVQETLDIFSLNNFGFVIFIPLLLLIIKAVF